MKTKQQEWYEWGKESFKRARNMILNNPKIYDTNEKIKEEYDNYGHDYMLKDKRDNMLIEKYGYTPELIKECKESFKKGFDASRAWYEKADKKYRDILAKYQPIFDKANEIAQNVDVSDIHDGFPCGSAHLYLQEYPETEDLAKALAHFSTYTTREFKYRLPIKIPTHGQCVEYGERICRVVNEFLRENGISANIYSWLD